VSRSAYEEIVFRSLEEHVLLSVLLELTYRCNLDCAYCYNDLGLRGRRLDDDDYFRLLDDLRTLQVLQLSLSGGEPLASPAFWPVGRRARELGFVVRVKSNGHALRAPVAERLKREIDPYVVESSLHGACAATHDRQTRVEGSFERLIENLGAMRDAGLRVRLNCTLTTWNEDEVDAMFALADGLGVPLFFDPVVTPRDDGDREPLKLAASPAAVERLYGAVERRQRPLIEAGQIPEPAIGRHQDVGNPGSPGLKSCGTGSSTLAIDPYGNVYPCVQWRRSVGNVHERSIREIWGGSAELDEIRATSEAAGRMIDRLGPEGRKMGFCLGIAAELAGDPQGLYPQIERNLESLRRMTARKSSGLPIVR